DRRDRGGEACAVAAAQSKDPRVWRRAANTIKVKWIPRPPRIGSDKSAPASRPRAIARLVLVLRSFLRPVAITSKRLATTSEGPVGEKQQPQQQRQQSQKQRLAQQSQPGMQCGRPDQRLQGLRAESRSRTECGKLARPTARAASDQLSADQHS